MTNPLRKTRVLLHSLLTSERGNALVPVRLFRSVGTVLNDLVGRPLRSTEEFQRGDQEVSEAESALAATRRNDTEIRREPAPVVVYVTDQDYRTPKRIGDVLKGREIPYTINDVTEDEATRSWALTQAHADQFPLVFIAGEPVGGLDELMQLDVSGELLRKLYGS